MKTLNILLIIIFINLTGCSVLKLNKDLEKLNKLVTIKGEVSVISDTKSPIMIALIKTTDTNIETIEYIHKKDAGKFEFNAEIGTYHIYAWADQNNNSHFENNEPITQCSLNIEPGVNTQAYCKLIISKKADSNRLNEIEHIKNTAIENIAMTHNVGTLISLEDDAFSEVNASKGLWEAYSFMQEVPSGLFLLEKYNPNKEVVLFVHGINGTPQNFKYIINNINTETHQVMLFYYPSGLRLSDTATYLDYLMQEFQIKYQLKNITIIAHSMGGLLSKEYINIQQKHNHMIINNFISISTPWSGHSGAQLGLEYAPDVIPVWNDMAPQSQFIKKLFDTKYKNSPKHTLFFGFKGTSLFVSENSDGVVSINTQLRAIAQDEAYIVKGFNEDHMSILQNRELIYSINNILSRKY